jgi:hypothetical protein
MSEGMLVRPSSKQKKTSNFYTINDSSNEVLEDPDDAESSV